MMKRNRISKFCALAITCLMLVGMIATPVFAADDPNEVTDVTATGGLAIVDTSPSDSGATLTTHKYNVYQVMKKQVVGDDGQGNAVYQYKLTDDFAGFTSENFAIDAQNGAITTKAITFNGTEYPAGTKLTSDVNSDGTTNTNSTLASLLARELQLYANEHATPTKVMAGGASADVVQGWYLVFEAENNSEEPDGLLATKPVLLNVVEGSNTVTIKDASVSLDKGIYDPNAIAVKGGEVTDADYSIGDEIYYRIWTNFPTYAANVDPDTVTFVITDTQTAGLTVDVDDIDVYVTGTNPTEAGDDTFTLTQDGQTFTIRFDGKYVLEHQGYGVTVEYKATLNENAIVNSIPDSGLNKNTVTLQYSTNPGVTEESKTLTDEVEVFTFAVDFHKLDGAHGTELAGAKFTLQRTALPVPEVPEIPAEKGVRGDSSAVTLSLIKDTAKSTDTLDVYRPAMEGETGVTEFTTSGKEIRFYGLEFGAYVLTETAAPSGYSKLADPIEFTILPDENEEGKPIVTVSCDNTLVHFADDITELELTDEGGTVTVDMSVNNYEGITLPSTGSLTSILVMGGGAAVVLGGGAFLFARRKKEDDEDEE